MKLNELQRCKLVAAARLTTPGMKVKTSLHIWVGHRDLDCKSVVSHCQGRWTEPPRPHAPSLSLSHTHTAKHNTHHQAHTHTHTFDQIIMNQTLSWSRPDFCTDSTFPLAPVKNKKKKNADSGSITHVQCV